MQLAVHLRLPLQPGLDSAKSARSASPIWMLPPKESGHVAPTLRGDFFGVVRLWERWLIASRGAWEYQRARLARAGQGSTCACKPSVCSRLQMPQTAPIWHPVSNKHRSAQSFGEKYQPLVHFHLFVKRLTSAKQAESGNNSSKKQNGSGPVLNRLPSRGGVAVVGLHRRLAVWANLCLACCSLFIYLGMGQI